ncbi:MAG: hypothetical protein LBO09_08920 [Candidatus Peribacteria bacterium]|jgi:hypothetical protein|nr:hypothetical protein [Candidatus Peribacteria bacterium]
MPAKKRSLTLKIMRRNKKRWGIFLLSFVCIVGIATIFFVACDSSENESSQDVGVEYPVPENAEVIVDVAVPFKIPGGDEVLTTENDDLIISIGISARVFYLPKDIKHYKEYYKLLSADKNKPNILKFTIGDNNYEGASPIIKVEVPTEEEYLKAKERLNDLIPIDESQEITEAKTRATSLASTIPSISAMNTAFNYIKNLGCPLSGTCIPFRYAADGCYARAHYMRKILADNYGYDCSKIFSFGSPLAATSLATGCCAEWSYHVAVLVSVDNGTTCLDRVFDPSLFNQPVTITEWVNKQKGCVSSTGSVSYTVKASNYYSYGGGTYYYDNSYTNTYSTLSTYSGCSGCGYPCY